MWVSGKATPSGEKLLKIAEVLDIIPDLFPTYLCKECEHREPRTLGRQIQQELERKPNALVIDNHVYSYMALQWMLDIEGYRTLWANTPNLSKDIFKTTHVDLILLDLLFPEERGEDYIERFLSERRKVIVITGEEDRGEKVEAMKTVIVLYKPIKYSYLKVALRKIRSPLEDTPTREEIMEGKRGGARDDRRT